MIRMVNGEYNQSRKSLNQLIPDADKKKAMSKKVDELSEN